MGVAAVLATGVAAWVLFFAVMKALEHVFRERLYYLLENRLHLTVQLGHIRWYTRRFNRFFCSFGQRHKAFLTLWFDFGVLVSFLALLLSVFILLYNLYWSLAAPEKEQVLTPVIPGVNVPSSQVPYYLIALLVSGIIHEFGHAIATTSEGGSIEGSGVFLFFLYPGAFVDIKDSVFVQLSKWKQLKIFCAGAWHNVVVGIVCLLLLWFLPLVLSPFYSTGGGVVVSYVSKDSPFYGHTVAGDVLTGVGDCQVNTLDNWVGCLFQLSSGIARNYGRAMNHNPDSGQQPATMAGEHDAVSIMPPEKDDHMFHKLVDQNTGRELVTDVQGFCLSARALREAEGDQRCCFSEEEVMTTTSDGQQHTLQCFYSRALVDNREELVSRAGFPELPPSTQPSPLFCHVAREVAINNQCIIDEDCNGSAGLSLCVRGMVDPITSIIKVTKEDGSFLLFNGHPQVVFSSLVVSNYTPRWSIIRALTMLIDLPLFLEKLLRYLISISGALAIINMAPVFYLDGQHACEAFVAVLWPDGAPRKRQLLCKCIFWSVTVLFILNVIFSLRALAFSR
ncbi:Membrane-bound transcription factor site-2 protease [Balamuthia mandrillaris]